MEHAHPAPDRPGRRVATFTGWTTALVGIALLPLPGPGGLVIVAGLRLLAPHHRWAARVYEPAERRALTAARLGVATWPRLALTALGPAWLVVAALAYTHAVGIPEVSVAGLRVGPGLPLAGAATTVGLWCSAVVAAALVVIAALRWGPVPVAIRGGRHRAGDWAARLRRRTAHAIAEPSAASGTSAALLAAVGLVIAAS